MKRLLGFVPFIAGLLFTSAAWACSCAPQDPDDFVAHIGILFDGALVGTENVQPPLSTKCKGGVGPECAETPTGVFRVDTPYKGELGDMVLIIYSRQDGVNCGASLRMNETMTIAAYGDPEHGYETSMCAQAPIDRDRARAAVMDAVARYHRRLEQLDAAITKDPGNPAPSIAKARFLGETNASGAALKLLAAVLANEQTNRDAVLLAAQLQSARAEDDLALAVLDPYLAKYPDDADALRAQATSLVRLGRMAEIPSNWRDFSQLVGEKFDFSGRVMEKASFHLAKLRESSFAGTSLKQSDFSGAQLWNVIFDRADLEGADLSTADVQGSFRGANLKGAKLAGGIFHLKGSIASLEGADLTRARFYPEGPKSAALENVKATGVKAEKAEFEIKTMSGADFSHADLRQAVFYAPDLHGATFRNANLTSAEFRGSYSDGPADFRGVDFTGADLTHVTFSLALYDCKTIWPTGFDVSRQPLVSPAPGSESCAQKADFSWLKEKALTGDMMRDAKDSAFTGMDLNGVSFRGAWLPGEYFWNAKLRGADFTLAKGKLDLRGADASGADFSYVNFAGSNLFGVGGSAAIVDGAIFHGAILPIRSIDAGRSDDPAPDLSKARLKGLIFPDDPALWPKNIDPVSAGIVFLEGPKARKLYPAYSLKDGDLKGFDLSGGDFSRMDLKGADLRGASLFETDFSGATLAGAELKGACYGKSTHWPSGFDYVAAGAVYCGLVGYNTSTYGEDLSSGWSHTHGGLDAAGNLYVPPSDTPAPDFAGETWDEVMWLAAWLPGAKMDGGSFVHAMMKGVNLNGASLVQANLTGADLRDSLIEGANLSGAKLQGADLRKASLKSSRLEGAQLEGAIFDAETVWPYFFDFAKAGARQE